MTGLEKFKPICVSLTQNANEKDLSRMLKLIKEADPGVIQELQEYLLFPLYIILSSKKPRKEVVTVKMFEAISQVFLKTRTRTSKVAFDFTLHCLLHIYKIGKSEELPEWPEEVKLSAVKTISAILSSCEESVIRELHSKACRPMLGQLVFTALQVAVLEKLHALRLEALRCLDLLFTEERVDREVVAESLSEFVPGVVSHLEKIISGGEKQPQIITQKGLETYGNFITLIFSDDTFRTDAEDSTRNSAFLQKSIPNLLLLTERMVQQVPPQSRAKLGLVAMATGIVTRCSSTLNEMLPLLIRKIIQLNADVDDSVRTSAGESIGLIKNSSVDVTSALRQILYDLAISLPRLIATRSSKEQPLALQELEGTLSLLGSDLETTLMFSGLRDKLLRALLQSASLEDSAAQVKGIHFRYLESEAAVENFARCCRILGSCSSLEDLSQQFLEIHESRKLHYREALIVLNFAIAGAVEKDFETLLAVAKTYGSLLQSADDLTGLVILEGITEISRILGEGFQPVLRYVLKPLLEKAGDPNLILNEAAVSTLENIRVSLKLDSVPALLSDNLDYFAPQLSYQLKDCSRYPSAINAVRALLQFKQIQVQPWLQQTVETALKGLDHLHLKDPKPFLEVLDLFCSSVKRLPELKQTPGEVTEPSCWNRLMERVRTFEESERFHEDQVKPEEEPQLNQVEEAKEETLPKPVNIVSDILNRCVHLLTRRESEDLQPLLLSIIYNSIEYLCDYENVFLPKVYQLWDPLKTQLLSQNLLTQRQLCQVVLLLLDKCADFLHRSFVTDLLPHLLKFLQSQASCSELRGKMAAGNYAYSQAYKLQLLILSKLGRAVFLLKTDTLVTAKVLAVLTIYLGSKQLEKLQTAATDSIREISRYDPDAVWMALHSIGHRRTLSMEGYPSINVGCPAESMVENLDLLMDLLKLR